jgi:hypothetical protein
MRPSLACVALALAFAACSEPSEPLWQTVIVTPTNDTFLQGDAVTATLVNASDISVSHGSCPIMRLEQQVEGRWTAVSQAPRVCTGVVHVLAPGAEEMLEVDPDPVLGHGTYRLAMSIFRHTSGGPGYEIRSSPFFVPIVD